MASSNSNRRQTPSHSGSRNSGSILAGAVFLGICILIAGLNIGGNLKKLSKTIQETTFSDSNSFSAPTDLTYTNKKYLTEAEAAAYLNLSTQQITELIQTGEIKKYVKTDTGYSIAADVLDDWFDNEAYQNTLTDNP